MIGIIGGSGLYEMEGVQVLEERTLETPFGEPSDPYVIGDVDGIRVAFLSRHGRGHRKMPTEINYRANLFGFKLLGTHTILSASAVGSMKEQYAPTDLVFPLQFIDRTRHRPDTFFGNGVVAHVTFADPICTAAAAAAASAAREAGANVHEGGTYLCMEGPQFSTRAESNLYRSWGVDVIGMTNLTEAKLAREAERLRLLARVARSGQRRAGPRLSARECRHGAESPPSCHPESRGANARLRLSQRAPIRPPDRPECDFGAGPQGSRAADRQVPGVKGLKRMKVTQGSATRSTASSLPPPCHSAFQP